MLTEEEARTIAETAAPEGVTVRVALFDCGSRLGVGACIKGRRDAKPLPRDVGENEIRAAVAELVERLHAKH